jgi:hypothetical protein
MEVKAMIEVNTEAIQDSDRKRYEELVAIAMGVDGMKLYADMLARKVPLHLMRDVLVAAVTAKVDDLDWCVSRTEQGNFKRHPSMTERRKAIYSVVYNLRQGDKRKYSLPEIATAFGTSHTSVWYTLYALKRKPRVKLFQRRKA